MTGATEPLGIVELVDVCDVMQQHNEMLFRRLGELVTQGEAGAQCRILAEACHRHAWHAELWAARRPIIPVEPSIRTSIRVPDGLDVDYRTELDELRSVIGELAGRFDRGLDPSTARVIDLVMADLDALGDRLGRPS